jgi:hypothetical protein
MPKKSDKKRVHLDHLLPRQSIRYVAPKQTQRRMELGKPDPFLNYNEIIRPDGRYNRFRKPDFQRETNAWAPSDCLDFLDSVVHGRIIPSIILWYSPENGLVYVLDGAHRLSVIRAWILDDWGDKDDNYYERRDLDAIKQTAQHIRELVEYEIGSFSRFQSALEEYLRLGEEGKVQRDHMGTRKFTQATFLNRTMVGLDTLSVQWENGDYKSAEQSFLRINRRGQPLDPWEANLIEYRNGSYARCVMTIANAGSDGHYWPDPVEDLPNEVIEKVKTFNERAANIHKMLFVPPLKSPIADINVPFMVAPAYFQKHKYLLEIVPLIAERKTLSTKDEQLEYMSRDIEAPVQNIINNGDSILSALEEGLRHLTGHTPISLSIVPLFYWYNLRGQYARGLFYGFLYWLLGGTEQEIADRKLLFSANRGRFEEILFTWKREIATLQEKGGAGLYAAAKVAQFFQQLLELLHNNPNTSVDDLGEDVIAILKESGRISVKTEKAKTTRLASRGDKSQVNIRNLFKSSVRCHICDGIVDLKSTPHYDHVVDYHISPVTDPDTIEPTHPFCNNHQNKQKILDYRAGKIQPLKLPAYEEAGEVKTRVVTQLSYWGEDNFPS